MTPWWKSLALVGLAGLTACAPGAGTLGDWATKLEAPPRGLTLDPPPPSDLYWVAISSAEIPVRTNGGQLWDEVSGWPDPVVRLSIDGRDAMVTSSASDTIHPSWTSPRGNLAIANRATIQVVVTDADPLANLRIGTGKAGPPSSADLTEGKMVIDIGRRGKVVLSVAPAHALLGLGFDYEVVTSKTLVRKVLAHSPAGRAGLAVGDEILAIGERSLQGAKSREVRSAINSIGSKPARITVRHSAGTTESFDVGVGPTYPLYAEYGDLE